MTMPLEKIRAALDSIEIVMKNSDDMNSKGAMILGAHLEGPFINKKYKGAQPENFIIAPDLSLIEDYEQVIKVVTIAPEIKGALPLMDRYKDSINFSIGHSAASYEEAMEAFGSGAKSVTHLFNAMTGLHHRKPGIVGAALTCDCYCEIIADKFHVHENLFQLLLKSKGLDRILLITDCMQAGGLSEGKYELGGLEVTVNNKQCRLNDGTIAGSVLRLNEGLYNFSESIVEKLEHVIPLVTSNQATYLNVEEEMGTLEVNKLANIVLINSKIEVSKTIVRGKVVYENQL
jgi:N-acetylglucosamine-6-phosphate deacetylase